MEFLDSEHSGRSSSRQAEMEGQNRLRQHEQAYMDRVHPVLYAEHVDSIAPEIQDEYCATVDTGCQRTAVGSDTLRKLIARQPPELQVQYKPESHCFKSVNGISKTNHVACVPTSLGRKGCILRPAVFSEGQSRGAPFLLSLPFLLFCKATLVLNPDSGLRMILGRFGHEIPMHIGPTGALRVPLNQFSESMLQNLQSAMAKFEAFQPKDDQVHLVQECVPAPSDHSPVLPPGHAGSHEQAVPSNGRHRRRVHWQPVLPPPGLAQNGDQADHGGDECREPGCAVPDGHSQPQPSDHQPDSQDDGSHLRSGADGGPGTPGHDHLREAGHRGSGDFIDDKPRLLQAGGERGPGDAASSVQLQQDMCRTSSSHAGPESSTAVLPVPPLAGHPSALHILSMVGGAAKLGADGEPVTEQGGARKCQSAPEDVCGGLPASQTQHDRHQRLPDPDELLSVQGGAVQEGPQDRQGALQDGGLRTGADSRDQCEQDASNGTNDNQKFPEDDRQHTSSGFSATLSKQVSPRSTTTGHHDDLGDCAEPRCRVRGVPSMEAVPGVQEGEQLEPGDLAQSRRKQVPRRQIISSLRRYEAAWTELSACLGPESNQALTSLKERVLQDMQRPSKPHLAYYTAFFNMSEKQLKTVAEIFNPKVFTPKAARHQLHAGRAFDIALGHDLLDPVVQHSVITYLQHERPGLVLLAPPCGSFSQLQNLGKQHRQNNPQSLQKYLSSLRQGKKLLRFACKVCEVCAAMGSTFLLEHPWAAKSWQERCLRQVQALPGAVRVRCDQCQFGLVDRRGQPVQKATGLVTNNHGMAQQLAKRCSREHGHSSNLRQLRMSGPRIDSGYAFLDLHVGF